MLLIKLLFLIPLHVLPIGAYMLFYSPVGSDISLPLMSFGLPTGVQFSATSGDLFVLFSIAMLMGELLKATQTGWWSLTNHALSMLLLIASIGMFLTVAQCGTIVWFLIVSTLFLDVMLGWMVTTIGARRDFNVG